MKLILVAKVDKIGESGDVVQVRPGFGRNFLIPRRLAVLYSENAYAAVRKKKQAQEEKRSKEVEGNQLLAKKISATSCTIKVQAGEGDQLYGSVTNHDIQLALETQGLQIDKHMIVIDEAIKKLGIYTVKVMLMPELAADLKIWVVRQ